MNFKSKLYISLFVSFVVLIASLIINYTNINNTNKIIHSIQKEQIKLFYLANKLNYDVKRNQANILQSIVLNEKLSEKNIITYFNNLSNLVEDIKSFIKNSDINSQEISKMIEKL